jgi:hypothetical protein
MGFPRVTSDGGVDVIIYSTTAGNSRPIHGAYNAGHKFGWCIITWPLTGRYLTVKSDLDISKAIENGEIKIPQQKTEEGTGSS